MRRSLRAALTAAYALLASAWVCVSAVTAAALEAMAAAAAPSWPVTWPLALAAAVVAAALALPRPPFFLRLGLHFFSAAVSAVTVLRFSAVFSALDHTVLEDSVSHNITNM